MYTFIVLTLMISNDSIGFGVISFFVSSCLSLTSVYLLTAGAEGSPLHLTTLSDSTYALVRTPLHEGSESRREFYLTTHNTHKGLTYMPPGGFRTP